MESSHRDRRQHFRPFEAERATGMDVDFNRAASHLADDFGECAGVFHVEITVWPGQGKSHSTACALVARPKAIVAAARRPAA